MKTIELSAAIASAPVQENLKNFAGLDAQNALGLMTPERLAAVAGDKLQVLTKEITRPKDSDTVIIKCYMSLIYVYSISEGKNNLLIKTMSNLKSISGDDSFLSRGLVNLTATDTELKIKFVNDEPANFYILLISPY